MNDGDYNINESDLEIILDGTIKSINRLIFETRGLKKQIKELQKENKELNEEIIDLRDKVKEIHK
jgi:uncharacterized coiled-coil DUF342 family protein